MNLNFTKTLLRIVNKNYSLYYDVFEENFSTRELHELALLYVIDMTDDELYSLFKTHDFIEDFRDFSGTFEEFLYAYFEKEIWKEIERAYYTMDYYDTDAAIDDEYAHQDYMIDRKQRAIDATYGY